MTAGDLSPRERLAQSYAVVVRAYRFWWLVALVGVIGTGASVGAAFLKKHYYLSETMILYRQAIPTAAAQEGGGEGQRDLGQRVGDTLHTRPRLEQVIKEFDLYKDVVEQKGYVEAVDQMRRDIIFHTRGTGTSFQIQYRAATPELAQKVTARLASILIEEDSRYRAEQANQTIGFLRSEHDRAEKDLGVKEHTLAEFLTKHPEFAAQSSGGSGSAVRATSPQIAPVDASASARIFTLEQQRARLVSRLQAADAATARAPVVSPTAEAEARVAHARVEDARRDVQAAEAELSLKLTQYTDKHPDVTAARRRVDEARRRLRDAEAAAPAPTAAATLAPPTPAERRELQNRVEELDIEISAERRRTALSSPVVRPTTPTTTDVVVGLETEWQRVNREALEARERIQVLDGRVFTAQISADSEKHTEESRMQIIDPAFRPTKPAGLTRKTIVALGGFLSLMLGVGLALVLAFLDDRIYSAHDLSKLNLGPVLVTIEAPLEKKALLPVASRQKRLTAPPPGDSSSPTGGESS